jgi:isocitrate dehydrogenase
MKLTDGLFHKVFDEIGVDYPELEKEHWIIDIGAAKMADTPELFDVLVMPNLYGDILSDVAAQIAGSVGLAGSANVGDGFAMFEAIHGSAPRRAGQDKANPSGLLQGAILMLNHLGQGEVAELVQNAWLRTLEDGLHTYDIATPEHTRSTVGTQAFARAVVERLGQKPEKLPLRHFSGSQPAARPLSSKVDRAGEPRATIGVDVFLNAPGAATEELGKRVSALGDSTLQLKMITNRGVKVWPDGMPETFCTDHWRCRFVSPDQKPLPAGAIVSLLQRVEAAGLDFIKTENLCTFGGERAYSLGQGE